MKSGFILVSFIVLCIIWVVVIYYGDNTDIHKWAENNKISINSIEYRTVCTGPYWIIENARVYKVETSNGTYWIRYLFGRSIKKEISSGTYEKIE